MKTECYSEITAPRWGAEEKEYQTATPKKEYVYHTHKNGALIHRIREIRLRWWTYGPNGAYLIRLASPRMTAITPCGQWIGLDSTRAKMCAVPKPDAVLCAACHGKGRNFPRNKEPEIPLALAKVRLGCVRS